MLIFQLIYEIKFTLFYYKNFFFADSVTVCKKYLKKQNLKIILGFYFIFLTLEFY